MTTPMSTSLQNSPAPDIPLHGAGSDPLCSLGADTTATSISPAFANPIGRTVPTSCSVSRQPPVLLTRVRGKPTACTGAPGRSQTRRPQRSPGALLGPVLSPGTRTSAASAPRSAPDQTTVPA